MAIVPDKSLTPAEIEQNREMVRHLKAWFRFRGFTQERIANILEVSEATVSKWLKGTQPMTVGTFTALAAILGTEPHRLLFPPEDQARADTYRRASSVLERLDAQRVEQWLGVGEATTGKGGDKISSD